MRGGKKQFIKASALSVNIVRTCTRATAPPKFPEHGQKELPWPVHGGDHEKEAINIKTRDAKERNAAKSLTNHRGIG